MSEDDPENASARRIRRASTRHEVEIEARVSIADRTEPAVISDLSMSGAFVRTAPIPMGTAIVIHFRITGVESEIEAPAIVRWHSDEGLGVQFDGLRARDAWALGRLLRTLS